jgi:hypothetical protein
MDLWTFNSPEKRAFGEIAEQWEFAKRALRNRLADMG